MTWLMRTEISNRLYAMRRCNTEREATLLRKYLYAWFIDLFVHQFNRVDAAADDLQDQYAYIKNIERLGGDWGWMAKQVLQAESICLALYCVTDGKSES